MAAETATTTTTTSSSSSASGGSLESQLKSMKEWTRAAAYDDSGKVLASTFEASPTEIKDLLTLFDDYDTTVGNGLVLAGEHYDVHRFYENLIYGRRGDSATGEGVCICKVTAQSSKKPMFGIITYGFPTLSARAVPQLRDFCKQHLEVL